MLDLAALAFGGVDNCDRKDTAKAEKLDWRGTH
jgi:hypothetical protein